MSKFLTPPVWYDKNGSEINIFNNTTYDGVVENTAIGTSAIAGSEGSSYGSAVAVGSQAQAKASLSIAIGSYNDDNFQTVQALATGSIAIGAGAKANADSTDGIAIGSRTTSGQGGIAIGGGTSATGGGIAIGDGASATANQIQLGNPNSRYDLKIGNGTSSTVQAGGYKIGTTTIIDSNGNIRGNSFLSTGYIQCPVLQISSNKVGYGNFTQSNKRGSINIIIGDSDNALYLITIMARHEDGTYRQHFGFISSSKFPPNYTPDTVIEVPMIVKVNYNDAPYSNDWSVAYFEFSPNTAGHPLYCDFTKVIRSKDAMIPYNTNVFEVWVYVHKIINFPNPLAT